MRIAMGLVVIGLWSCSTNTTTTLDADSEEDGGVIRDVDTGAPIVAMDAGQPAGSSCHVDEECASGLQCLYWGGGCEGAGTCGVPPRLDAVVICPGVCDCQGYWRGNTITNFPFQFRSHDFDWNGRTCSPYDGGVADAWNPWGDGNGPLCETFFDAGVEDADVTD